MIEKSGETQKNYNNIEATESNYDLDSAILNSNLNEIMIDHRFKKAVRADTGNLEEFQFGTSEGDKYSYFNSTKAKDLDT